MRKHHEVYNFFCISADGMRREKQLVEDIKREIAAGEHASFTTLAKAVDSDRTRVRNFVNSRPDVWGLYYRKKAEVRAASFIESIKDVESLHSEGCTMQEAAAKRGMHWSTYYRRKRIVDEVLTGQTS